MKYNEVRPNIHSGDVLAWSHKTWGSFYDLQVQAIRIFTRSEYNHIGIAWVVGDRVFVIEAVEPEVRIYPLSVQTPFYWVPCGAAYWDKPTQEYALSKIGEKYSKIEAIKGFFDILTVGKDAKWQCAELVNSVLKESRMLSITTKSTPAALIESLMNMGFPTYLVS
jgi:hypothetical protein